MSSGFTGKAEGVDRAGAGGTAKAHFADNSRKADQDDKDKIRDQESTASVEGDAGWKHPDIAHADCRTDAGQYKAPSAVKRFSFSHIISFQEFRLFIIMKRSSFWITASVIRKLLLLNE